jgi:hypothetical protein
VGSKGKEPSLLASPESHEIRRTYNKRPTAGQLATKGAYGLAAATISKSLVIIGKLINSTYSGTG